MDDLPFQTNQKNKMKKEDSIVIALLLVLIMQTFNVSNFYGDITHLEGIEKFIGRYFVAISFEFSVFICIINGYKFAGRFFAFMSLVVGMLYHVEFNDLREIDFYFKRWFISSAVMQIFISSLSLFLSELYAKSKDKKEAIKTLIELELDIKIEREEYTSLLQKIDDKAIIHNKIKQDIINMNNQRTDLEQEIKSLQKKKAGSSRSTTVSID